MLGVRRTRKLDLRHTHLPSAERVRDSWKEDALFGYQFLNGANPMLLRRSTCLPSRLVFPPGMEKLQAQLAGELKVWTAEPSRVLLRPSYRRRVCSGGGRPAGTS